MIQERMKSLRLEAKLTQKEIAEKLGISTAFYGQWETGKKTPASKNLGKLADFFNVSIDYLLGSTDIKNQKRFDDDLDNSLDTFKSFDGKPMYDDDRDKIREFIKNRMEDRLKNS